MQPFASAKLYSVTGVLAELTDFFSIHYKCKWVMSTDGAGYSRKFFPAAELLKRGSWKEI